MNDNINFRIGKYDFEDYNKYNELECLPFAQHNTEANKSMKTINGKQITNLFPSTDESYNYEIFKIRSNIIK